MVIMKEVNWVEYDQGGFQGCHQRECNIMCGKWNTWTVIMSGY